MIPFFITGLPRSRTAWMANFFTHGPAFCWHDKTREFGSAFELRKFFVSERAARPDIQFLGDSDSALLLIADEVLSQFPDARWVLIRRNSEDCRRSWNEYFTAKRPYPGVPQDPATLDRVFTMLEGKLAETEELLPASQCARVNFEDLSSEHTMRLLWDWCIPGQRFPLERWLMLNTFQLNVLPGKLKGVV